MTPRHAASVRVLVLFVLAQLTSRAVVQHGCSGYSRGRLWTHGLAGPLAAVQVNPGPRYHDAQVSAGFRLVVVLPLITPVAHIFRPRRWTRP